MAVSASISTVELSSSVTQRYVGNYFEAALINAPSLTYTPGITADATLMSFEVVTGTAGYEREVFNYVSGDVAGYSGRNVSMAAKVTTFPHDGSVTPINFSHVALLWGNGNVVSLGAATSEPAAGNDGVYTNLPTVTDGSGNGLLVDLTISGGIFSYAVAKPGRGYNVGDIVTITFADLEAVGAIDVGSTTDNIVIPVSGISSGANGGNVIAVAQPTSSVVLTAGNEASFYWNLQLYGAS